MSYTREEASPLESESCLAASDALCEFVFIAKI